MGIGDFFNGVNSSWPIIRFAVVVLLIIVLGIFIWGSRSNILLGMTFALSIILFLPYLADLMKGGLIGLLMAARFGSERWNDIKVRADKMKQWTKEQFTAARAEIAQRQTNAQVALARWATQDSASKKQLLASLKEDILKLQAHRAAKNNGEEAPELDSALDEAAKLLSAVQAKCETDNVGATDTTDDAADAYY